MTLRVPLAYIISLPAVSKTSLWTSSSSQEGNRVIYLRWLAEKAPHQTVANIARYYICIHM